MPSCSRLRYLDANPRAAAGAGAWPADQDVVGTIVLLHGFPLGARMWEAQHALAEHGWRVVMPQLRGFDCATPDGADAASMEDYASDVADLLETLSIEKAVIGGISMGGYVTLALYRNAPALFRGIVLADTRAEADSPEGRANRTRMIDLAASGGAAAIASDMMAKLLGETTRRTSPAVEERVRAMIETNQPPAIQAALRAMMTRQDSTSLLSAIDVPALIIVGEEDTLTPPALSVAMAGSIARAELVRLPAAGHLSNLEQPQAFNAALLGFLSRV
jgi:pimeloyl-ACP methyl ester carboxylesterase